MPGFPEQRTLAIWRVLRQQGRKDGWLARRTGYSLPHIWNARSGQQRITAEFRAKCAFALDLPESILFAHDDAAAEAEEPLEVEAS